MREKGYTLMEVLVVVIILGVLASLGLTKYSSTIEKSRAAEAKEVIGAIRSMAIAHWHQYGGFLGANRFDDAAANIGTNPGQIPSAPRPSHFFTYQVAAGGQDSVTITATRCDGASCKSPSGKWSGCSIHIRTIMPDAEDDPGFEDSDAYSGCAAGSPWK